MKAILGFAAIFLLSCTDTSLPEFPKFIGEDEVSSSSSILEAGFSSSSSAESSSSVEEISSSSIAESSSSSEQPSSSSAMPSSSSVEQPSSSSVEPSSSSETSSSSSVIPSSSSDALCDGTPYIFDTEFCYDNSEVKTKCGGSAYTTNQFCYESKVYTRCNGTQYDPSAYFCLSGVITKKCGILEYDANQFCLGTSIHYKCASSSSGDTYTPVTEQCCGSKKYILAAQFCSSATTIYDKCGGTLEYDPSTHYCHTNGSTYSCGNKPYNPATQFCYNITIYDKCGDNDYNPSTHFCDIRNSKAYKFVNIGTQTWMAENLNYNAEGSKCYNNQESNCATYGRLYDWSMAMALASTYNSTLYSATTKHKGVCPSGWHLPSDAEWGALTQSVNPSCSLTGSCANAGKLLKATSGWNSSGNGTDNYGFAALPGGYGKSDGSFVIVGSYGNWLSATENNAYYAYGRSMDYRYEDVSSIGNNKDYLFSVRCLQD